jgi:hypothetical protein
MSLSNPTDRARLLVEDACDDFLQNADRTRNMKVVDFCNFFLFGEKNQTTMATQQLQEFFKVSNPKNVNHAAEYVSSYRFDELIDSLLAKYNSCPEGWQQQRALYAEVARSIYHVLKAPNHKIVTFALSLLSTLCTECHRAHNRFLLEALFSDDLLRQIRVLWKTHSKKTGHYSTAITEEVLKWVQEWRDELVPSSQRKRYDPANQTQWSLKSLQSSVKSYSTMSQTQLQAAAQSGAHWLDKRLKEFSGETTRDQGIFSSLEDCHYKLKKRGAKFPEVDFSSSSLRGSFDIQRCSEDDAAAAPTQKPKPSASTMEWDAFASASESPNSVTEPVVEESESPSALKIKIRPVAMHGSDGQQAEVFFLAPPLAPPLSSTKIAAAPQKQCTSSPAPAPVAAAPTETFDFLDFGGPVATPASGPVGNPFGDNFSAVGAFDGSEAAMVSAAATDDSDPFAALAMRNC